MGMIILKYVFLSLSILASPQIFAYRPCEPESPQASECRPLIVGFHGAEFDETQQSSPSHVGPKEQMIQLLCEIEYEIEWETQTEIESLLVNSSDVRLVNREVSLHNAKCSSYPVIFIGHSWGGATAVDVAHDEKISNVWEWIKSPIYSEDKDNMPDLLITLDPVSMWDYKLRRFEHTKWINIYAIRSIFSDLLTTSIPIFGNWIDGAGRYVLAHIWRPIHRFIDSQDASEKQFQSNLCDSVASFGGYWGKEIYADENIGIEADHCSILDMYDGLETVHEEVETVMRHRR